MHDPITNHSYGFKKPQTSKTGGSGINHGFHKRSANAISAYHMKVASSRDTQINNQIKQLIGQANVDLKKKKEILLRDYNIARLEWLSTQINKQVFSIKDIDYDKSNSEDRYSYDISKDEGFYGGNKAGVNGSLSFGMQGEVPRLEILGVGFGAGINLGSYDLVNGEVDLINGVSYNLPYPKTVLKKGADLKIGLYGVEYGYERETDLKQKVITDKDSFAGSVGPFKIIIESIDEYTYENNFKKYVKTKSFTRPMLTLSGIRAKMGYGLKGEIKAEATINLAQLFYKPRSIHKYDRYPWMSRQDATFVNKKYIKGSRQIVRAAYDKTSVGVDHNKFYTLTWRATK